MDAKEALERLYPAMQDAHVQRSKFYAPRGPVKTEADADNDLDLEALAVLRAVVSERDALKAEVVTLKQEISGNDSAHRLLLAEVERLKKGNEMVNQLLGEMTGKRDALKARLAEVQSLVEAVDKCPVEDMESCIEVNGQDLNPDPALDIIRAALAYRAAREGKDGR